MKEVRINRNYGIDLLKIVCMFFIVNLHVIGHGGLLKATIPLSFNNLVLSIIKSICICAVDCYAIITGYVYVNIKWKLKNIISLHLQVIFYSIIILAFMLIFVDGLLFKDIIKSFFPVLTTRYWYFTSYFGMFFLIPFINKFVNNIQKNDFLKLLILNFVLFSILASIGSGDIFSLSNGLSCWWFINLYLIGAYIKKYDITIKFTKNLFMYIISFIIILTSRFLILSLSSIKLFNGKEDFLFAYSSPFVLIMAISLVLIFKNLKFKLKIQKIISFVVPYSFGVYLIHDNSLVRSILISNKFIFLLKLNSLFLFLFVPLMSFIIFVICIFIDYIRACLFKILNISKLIDFLACTLNKVFNFTTNVFIKVVE